MKDLIIGYGEVGQAVADVLMGTREVAVYDSAQKEPERALPALVNVLHICFPPSKTFVREVKRYMERTQPRYTIIWSTVPIGTTKQLGATVVHSPVEGVHPRLAESIRTMRRWVGANSTMAASFMERYFRRLGLPVTIVPDSDYTEFLKLRSTAKYGVNLVWTDYEAMVAQRLGMDFSLLQQFDRDYNALYQRLGKPEYQRYILTPPGGKIGGHCILPNAEILDEQYPTTLLKLIKGMQ